MSVPRKAYGWGHGLGAPPPKAGDAQRECVQVGECRPAHRSTKDTRHWCKGRVGIPHTWEWQRRRWDLDHEQRFGIRYMRITEVPVCFGCGKIDRRSRSYCRECGEPWPELQRRLPGEWRWRWSDALPCVRCGTPWKVTP